MFTPRPGRLASSSTAGLAGATSILMLSTVEGSGRTSSSAAGIVAATGLGPTSTGSAIADAANERTGELGGANSCRGCSLTGGWRPQAQWTGGYTIEGQGGTREGSMCSEKRGIGQLVRWGRAVWARAAGPRTLTRHKVSDDAEDIAITALDAHLQADRSRRAATSTGCLGRLVLVPPAPVGPLELPAEVGVLVARGGGVHAAGRVLGPDVSGALRSACRIVDGQKQAGQDGVAQVRRAGGPRTIERDARAQWIRQIQEVGARDSTGMLWYDVPALERGQEIPGSCSHPEAEADKAGSNTTGTSGCSVEVSVCIEKAEENRTQEWLKIIKILPF
ncbi:hypothetical protein DFH09DRAFT_1442033 [Mycena vulgaris]|nr:hypothetical protein DFH09DRAFT_1442033 [Mycena vulgaris]